MVAPRAPVRARLGRACPLVSLLVTCTSGLPVRLPCCTVPRRWTLLPARWFATLSRTPRAGGLSPLARLACVPRGARRRALPAGLLVPGRRRWAAPVCGARPGRLCVGASRPGASPSPPLFGRLAVFCARGGCGAAAPSTPRGRRAGGLCSYCQGPVVASPASGCRPRLDAVPTALPRGACPAARATLAGRTCNAGLRARPATTLRADRLRRLGPCGTYVGRPRVCSVPCLRDAAEYTLLGGAWALLSPARGTARGSVAPPWFAPSPVFAARLPVFRLRPAPAWALDWDPPSFSLSPDGGTPDGSLGPPSPSVLVCRLCALPVQSSRLQLLLCDVAYWGLVPRLSRPSVPAWPGWCAVAARLLPGRGVAGAVGGRAPLPLSGVSARGSLSFWWEASPGQAPTARVGGSWVCSAVSRLLPAGSRRHWRTTFGWFDLSCGCGYSSAAFRVGASGPGPRCLCVVGASRLWTPSVFGSPFRRWSCHLSSTAATVFVLAASLPATFRHPCSDCR
ncbi:hypothetical protein Tco_0088646 [Tanacetum coccineum]